MTYVYVISSVTKMFFAKLDHINNEKVTEEANQRTWTLSTVL